jgi:hypothetical protein
MFLIFLSVQTVLTQPSIQVEATLEPHSVHVGGTILLSVTVKNPTSQILEDFDMQVSQTGFTVVESKKWSEKIEAMANLTGVYVLEAKSSGVHSVGLVATFAWIEDLTRMQGSVTVDVGNVEVKELPLKLSEQFWGGITALIGGVLGAVITGSASYVRGRWEERKVKERQRVEDKKNHERVKSLLLSELQFNERKVNIPLGPERENWEVIKDQGLYPILASNKELAIKVVDLYVELERYEMELNAGQIYGYNRDILLGKISDVYTLVEAWHFKPE